MTLPHSAPALIDANNSRAALQASVDRFVRAVAKYHDGLPVEDAVILLVPEGRGNAYGYFGSNVWDLADGRRVHEIGIVADYLDRGVEELGVTLLHELVHLYQHATGAAPPSRQGRYHSRAFAERAIEFGLTVAKDDVVGHVTTGLRDEARIRYQTELAELDQTLVLARREHGRDGPSEPSSPVESNDSGFQGDRPRRLVTAQCQCEVGRGRRRQIRVPVAGWEPDSIECRICDTAFTDIAEEDAF